MIRLILISMLLISGCGSRSLKPEDLPKASVAQASLTQARLDLAVLKENNAEWLVRDDVSRGNLISLSKLLDTATRYNDKGNGSEARRMALLVSAYVKLAQNQINRNQLVEPKYPEIRY